MHVYTCVSMLIMFPTCLLCVDLRCFRLLCVCFVESIVLNPMFMHACMHVCLCIHECMYECMYLCMWLIFHVIFVHMCVHVHFWVCAFIWLFLSAYTHMHTYVRIIPHLHTHKHAHTYMNVRGKVHLSGMYTITHAWAQHDTTWPLTDWHIAPRCQPVPSASNDDHFWLPGGTCTATVLSSCLHTDA